MSTLLAILDRFADRSRDALALAQVAIDIRAKRAAAYPALVATGRLDAGEAETALAAIDAIARDWQRRAGTPQPGDSPAGVPSRTLRASTLADAHKRHGAAVVKLRAAVPKGLFGAVAHLIQLGEPDTVLAAVLLDLEACGLIDEEPALARWADALEYRHLIAHLHEWEITTPGWDERATLTEELRALIAADRRAEAA